MGDRRQRDSGLRRKAPSPLQGTSTRTRSKEPGFSEPRSRPSPVRVPKAAELVAAHLRRQIIRGDIAEDEALPAEAELMHIYNVSRPTLREALRILESESLIVVKRGARGGARAALPDATAATMQREEAIVRRQAAVRLVPLDELADVALALGGVDAQVVAEEFDVTTVVAAEAMGASMMARGR